MIIKNDLLRNNIFYGLLAFCFISLPFPDYSFNTKAMIIFALYWLIYNSFSEKKALFKQNWKPIVILSSLFWVPLLGGIYTDDYLGMLGDLKMKLPFLLFPLILFTVQLKCCRKFLLNQFVFGVLAASLLAIGKALYFKWNHLGEYFYYSRFSEFLNRHTTYYSLFVVICVLWLLHLFLRNKKHRPLIVLGMLVFVFTLYLLSVRISIIALAVGGIVLFLSASIKKSIKWVFVLLIPIVLVLVYYTPHFQERFDLSTTDSSKINDISYRQLHWGAVLETIEHNNWVIGSGTKSSRPYLYHKYREYGLTAAYQEKYNAHNQYLEVILDNGLLGLLLFACLLIFLVYVFIRHKDYFSLSMILVFGVYMLTESLLQRTNGVVMFSLLMAVLFSVHWKKGCLKNRGNSLPASTDTNSS